MIECSEPAAARVSTARSRGIDLSHFCREVSFESMASAGVSFVYLKATEGGSFADPDFAAKRASARAAGLRVGACHFLTPDVCAVSQAQNFRSSAGSRAEQDLPPALDVESSPGWDRLARPNRILRVCDWLSRTEAAFGVKPVIYCSMSWWSEHFGEADFTENPLWLADEGDEPASTGVWPKWTIRQFANREDSSRGPMGLWHGSL